jgi:hypothetical protein
VIAVLSITTILLVYDTRLESHTRKHNEPANARLEHAATHDPLTGLRKRLLLADRLLVPRMRQALAGKVLASLVVPVTLSDFEVQIPASSGISVFRKNAKDFAPTRERGDKRA